MEGSIEGDLEVVPTDETWDGARWVQELWLDGSVLGVVALVSSPEDLEAGHPGGRQLTPEDLAAADRSPASILLSLEADDLHPVESFHRQVRLLAAAAPEAQLVLDVDACATHPRAWLWEVAECPVPPPADALLTIHVVFDPDDPRGGTWMHTHGLRRYGLPEIEALGVPRDRTGAVGELFNRIAARLMESELPEPGEPWEVGQDLEVLWLPWEEGLKVVKSPANGGADDRDDVHGLPSLMFFVPSRSWLPWKKKPQPLDHLLDRMSEHPVFWVTDADTRRMEGLAQLRWPRFQELFAAHGEAEGWVFLAKVGYPTDSGDNREHLWFEVHGVGPDSFEGTCINQPWDVSAIHEGLRGTHPLDLVSQWQIGVPELGSFHPDSVRHLLRLLED